MSIQHLDHVNLRTTQLDTMIAWYERVLGLTNGPRPAFPFPGAWLYAGDTAIVHLVGVEGKPAVGSEVDLKLEHFALTATDEAGFVEALTKLGEAYRRAEVPGTKLVQYNLWDPDGNHIHVDFR